MRMPFEQLMELVDALSDEDAALPMGALAARWDVPVLRVADAIDAVRVLHGERTYIEVKPEPEPPCRAFRWIGQPFSSCDRCGKPAWEHDGEERLHDGASPFDPDELEFRPWKPGEAEAIKRKWAPGVA